jgi:hypothetical protein
LTVSIDEWSRNHRRPVHHGFMAPTSYLDLLDFEGHLSPTWHFRSHGREKIAWPEDDDKVRRGMKVQLSCDSVHKAIPGGRDVSMDREINHLGDNFAKACLDRYKVASVDGKDFGQDDRSCWRKVESLNPRKLKQNSRSRHNG